MKKRVKNISSSSKKTSYSNDGKDISSSSKKSIFNWKSKIHDGKIHTAKNVLMLIGKLIICFTLICVIGLSIVITGMTVYVMKATDTDSSISLEKENIMDTGVTVVYGTNSSGSVVPLTRISSGTKRIWVDIGDVPAVMKNAIVAIEDKKFYQHDGVDFRRTFLAFLNMFLHFWSTDQGASTITQQLIKNLTNDRDTSGIGGMKRKTREIYRAMSLEKTYSKDQILQAYLNIIPVGGNNGDYEGIQAAAKLYYNKDIADVTLAEAASLAAITNAPVFYEPINNPEHNKSRRDETLKSMLELNMITKDEYDEAVNTHVEVHPGKIVGNTKDKDYQSYFVDAVLNQVVSDYMSEYNVSSWNDANHRIKSAGFHIYTTIDIDLQEKLETLYENPSTFGWGSFKSKPESAFVVYDLNGNMKACVGGTGEKPPGDRSTYNYATAVRSPGSTMKPIAAYAPAIEQNNITYSTIVEDTPIKKVDGNDWPKNYDKNYSGGVTVAHAVEKSLNTIPTKIVEKLGVQNVCDFLSNNLGISTLVDPSHPQNGSFESSGIAMGSLTNGVKLTELTNAYQIFGNGGHFTESHTYTHVSNVAGENVLKVKSTPKQAISSDTAVVMNRMLRNVITNGTGKAASLDNMNIEVVGKTGTSNDNKNLTFVGLTHDYVAGIWIGNVNGEDLPNNTVSPAKVWKTVMSSLLKGKKQEEFSCSDAKQLKFCKSSGLIANHACPYTAVGYYRINNVPKNCTKH